MNSDRWHNPYDPTDKQVGQGGRQGIVIAPIAVMVGDLFDSSRQMIAEPPDPQPNNQID